jgi:hypothetical protein
MTMAPPEDARGVFADLVEECVGGRVDVVAAVPAAVVVGLVGVPRVAGRVVAELGNRERDQSGEVGIPGRSTAEGGD